MREIALHKNGRKKMYLIDRVNSFNGEHRDNILETQKVFIRTYFVDSNKYIKYLRELQKENINYNIEHRQLSEKTLRSVIRVPRTEIKKYNRKYPERLGRLNFTMKYRGKGMTEGSFKGAGRKPARSKEE